MGCLMHGLSIERVTRNGLQCSRTKRTDAILILKLRGNISLHQRWNPSLRSPDHDSEVIGSTILVGSGRVTGQKFRTGLSLSYILPYLGLTKLKDQKSK